MIRITRDSKGKRKSEVITQICSKKRKTEVLSEKRKSEESSNSKENKSKVTTLIRITRDSKGKRKSEVIAKSSSKKRKMEVSSEKGKSEESSNSKEKKSIVTTLIRITRDSKGKSKSEVITKSSSKKGKMEVSSKKRKSGESSRDPKSQCRGLNNKKIEDERCLKKESRDKLSIFKSEPQPLPYKNAYDMYKKDPPMEKYPIQSLTQWKSVVGWQHIIYEKEFDDLAKKHQKKMKTFLKSLSAMDLELYFKLKILERKAKENT